MKRTDLLGIAVLLLPLGGCAINPLSTATTPAPMAKAKQATDAKQPSALPTDLESAIRSAQAARKNGDLAGATKILSQLVLVTPDDAHVLGEYGKALAAEGRSDDALAFLERATQLDPGDWSLYSAEGVALDQKGNYQAAQTFYARALTLKPGEASVLNNSALSHMQSGDLDGAEQLLRQAMPGSPDDARIAQNLALVQSLKAAQPPKAMAAATPAPAPTATPAPVQMASVTPPASAMPAIPTAVAPLPVPAPVVTTTLETQMPTPAVKPEPSAVEALKSDPSVRMQALPKETAAAPAPHELPAKPELASVPEKKAVQAPAPKAAATATPAPKSVNASTPAPKVAAAPAAAPAPNNATPAGPAPRLITAAARTPASSSSFYVQAGSFPTEERAVKSASNLDSMGARVMSGTVDGHAVYRVRIGPFLNIRQANAAVDQAHALGHADLAIVTE
ncbi:MAG TPA: tetratricopeptide repeat protein [Micropepsaceae bacterium]